MSASRAVGDPGASPKHGWVWTVLPADCRRVEVIDDPELAALLRTAGVPEVSTAASSPPGAAEVILIGDGASVTPAKFDRLARGLAPGGVLAAAVGGNAAAATSLVRRLHRIPMAVGTALNARRIERRLRQAGLRTRRIPTGERSGAHVIAVGGTDRLAHAGAIVVADGHDRTASVLERVVSEAGDALGGPPRLHGATVRGGGTLLVELSIPSSPERYFLRVVAGSSTRLFDAALRNLDQLEAEAPNEVLRRVVLPIAEGRHGIARWSVEAKVPGRQPRHLGSRLREECLDFLIALRSPLGSCGDAVAGLVADTKTLAPHLDAVERSTLAIVERLLLERLGALPSRWAHGDFWPGNLLVHRGRLAGVIDWDAADPASLPLVDLLHLLALSDRRTRRLPHGRRCSEVLWPLAREGGNREVGAYCEATATPADPATLEALAIAYWLTRVGRDLRTFADRSDRRFWMAENIHHPLAVLAGDHAQRLA